MHSRPSSRFERSGPVTGSRRAGRRLPQPRGPLAASAAAHPVPVPAWSSAESCGAQGTTPVRQLPPPPVELASAVLPSPASSPASSSPSLVRLIRRRKAVNSTWSDFDASFSCSRLRSPLLPPRHSSRRRSTAPAQRSDPRPAESPTPPAPRWHRSGSPYSSQPHRPQPTAEGRYTLTGLPDRHLRRVLCPGGLRAAGAPRHAQRAKTSRSSDPAADADRAARASGHRLSAGYHRHSPRPSPPACSRSCSQPRRRPRRDHQCPAGRAQLQHRQRDREAGHPRPLLESRAGPGRRPASREPAVGRRARTAGRGGRGGADRGDPRSGQRALRLRRARRRRQRHHAAAARRRRPETVRERAARSRPTAPTTSSRTAPSASRAPAAGSGFRGVVHRPHQQRRPHAGRRALQLRRPRRSTDREPSATGAAGARSARPTPGATRRSRSTRTRRKTRRPRRSSASARTGSPEREPARRRLALRHRPGLRAQPPARVRGGGRYRRRSGPAGTHLQRRRAAAPCAARAGLRGSSASSGLRNEFEKFGEETLIPNNAYNNLGVYVFEQAELGRWNLSLGARYDYRRLLGRGRRRARRRGAGPHLQFRRPATSACSTGWPSRWRWYSTWAGASARPTAFDLFSNGVHEGTVRFERGDSTLENETSINTDLALRVQTSTSPPSSAPSPTTSTISSSRIRRARSIRSRASRSST